MGLTLVGFCETFIELLPPADKLQFHETFIESTAHLRCTMLIFKSLVNLKVA